MTLATTTATSQKPRDGATVNMRVQKVKRDGIEDFFATGTAARTEDIQTLFDNIAGSLKNAGASIVHQDIFGPPDASEALTRSFGEVSWPLTIFPRSGIDSGLGTGTYVHAIAGSDIKRLTRDGRPVGSVYESSNVRYCRLGGLLPASRGSREDQTREIFQTIETLAGEAGMPFQNVVRTWFCLKNILDWHKKFCELRAEFFKSRRIVENVLPASTAVGGPNQHGAALLAGALAVEPLNESFRAERIPSPMQGPALEYGGAYSRAVELKWPGHRQLLVSGTASVAQTGKTFHSSNPSAQVRYTMEVVDALMKSRGMSWSHIVRTLAFVRSVADLLSLSRYFIDNNVPPIPTVVAQNTLCRDDLFFQVEVDAVAPEMRVAPE